MSTPGFTAEISLRPHRATYPHVLQAIKNTDGVHPQFFSDIILGGLSRCCIEGTHPGCCRALGEWIASRL
jgi:hypothetical protein